MVILNRFYTRGAPRSARPFNKLVKTALVAFISFILISLSIHTQAQKGEFLNTEDFHKLAFPEAELKWNTLWLTKEDRKIVASILGRKSQGLRVRYWGDANKTAWILEEIGKELPITVGVIIEGNAVKQLEILTYRESRGGEVRYPFFTQQFIGIKTTKPE